MTYPTPDIYKYDYSGTPTNVGFAEQLWAHWGSTASSGVLTLSGNALNGDTVTIGSKTYLFQSVLTDADGNVLIGGSASATLDNLIAAINLSSATGTLTFTSQPNDGDTITIDGKVYTFKTSYTNVDGNVTIGAASTDTRDNLVAALNRGSGSGSLYAALTTRQVSVAAVAGAGATMDVVARRGGAVGAVAVAESTATVRMSWSGSGFLVGEAGTDYADLMTRHPLVRAVAGAGDTADISARKGGTAGDSIASTESTATFRFSWGAATLGSGVASLSSKFNAIDPTDSTGGTGSFGFRLSAVDVTETWEANFRLEGTTGSPDATYGMFSLDPAGRVEDSSDPWATASSQWSEERRCTVNTGSFVIFIVEFDDAFIILHEDAGATYFSDGCHVGKVLAPLLQSDEDNGLSGLCVCGHKPGWAWSTLPADTWFSTTSTSKVQVATESWDEAGCNPAPTATESKAKVSSWNLLVPARTEPIPIVIWRTGARPLGVLKYCYSWSPEDYPKIRLSDTGGTVRYMFVYPGTYTIGPYLIAWNNTMVP